VSQGLAYATIVTPEQRPRTPWNSRHLGIRTGEKRVLDKWIGCRECNGEVSMQDGCEFIRAGRPGNAYVLCLWNKQQGQVPWVLTGGDQRKARVVWNSNSTSSSNGCSGPLQIRFQNQTLIAGFVVSPADRFSFNYFLRILIVVTINYLRYVWLFILFLKYKNHILYYDLFYY
jgi:hypothetical protein